MIDSLRIVGPTELCAYIATKGVVLKNDRSDSGRPKDLIVRRRSSCENVFAEISAADNSTATFDRGRRQEGSLSGGDGGYANGFGSIAVAYRVDR